MCITAGCSPPAPPHPRTYQEFLDWFADEPACRQYLARCRWPEGFECAQCGDKSEPWTTSRGYLHCRQCGSEVSVTAGTIFERTRMPLRMWFAAIWFVTSQKDGASALGLTRSRSGELPDCMDMVAQA